MAGDHTLSKETILQAFAGLNDMLREEGVIGEICVFGGTAMVLAFNARLSTKDVDAIFRPPEIFRRKAQELADEFGLPNTWLNDGVKGFVSESAEHTAEGLPQMSNLRVTRPTAEYLLAMKCMASRAAAYDTQGDRDDIGFLIEHVGLKTAEDVFKVVEKFYSPGRILPKTYFMIQEVIEQMPSRPPHQDQTICHLPPEIPSSGPRPQ